MSIICNNIYQLPSLTAKFLYYIQININLGNTIQQEMLKLIKYMEFIKSINFPIMMLIF